MVRRLVALISQLAMQRMLLLSCWSEENVEAKNNPQQAEKILKPGGRQHL
jgi:hypothetical protein